MICTSDMRAFLACAWAVLNNWAGYATGGLFVASAGLYLTLRDQRMPRRIGLALSALFLLMAFFKTWNEQKSLLRSAWAENRKLVGQIDDLARSRIHGTIDFAILGAQADNGSHAALVISLWNAEAPSAIEPGSWRLIATTADKIAHDGRPNTLLDKNLDFCLGPMLAMRFVRNDALYHKGSIPIPRNGFAQGVLWFGLSGLERSRLADPATILVLQARSIAGQDISISSTVQELIDKSKETIFFAGIENPRPLRIPCRDNVPY